MKQKMLGISLKSNKYVRNPRMKGWMLCKRLANGDIQCLADTSIFSVEWSSTVGILWFRAKDAIHYCNSEGKLISKLQPGEEMFVARVNSKNCPVVVDFEHMAPRATKGNVYFEVKK